MLFLDLGPGGLPAVLHRLYQTFDPSVNRAEDGNDFRVDRAKLIVRVAEFDDATAIYDDRPGKVLSGVRSALLDLLDPLVDSPDNSGNR